MNSIVIAAGFSTDLNLQDVLAFELKYLDVSVQNLEVMQHKKTQANIKRKHDTLP